MRTDERYEDEPPWLGHRPEVDGAWGRTANPNTADGELQNMAAFSSGLTRLTGPRRIAAQAIVWLILAGIVLAILATVVHQFRGGR